MLGMWTTSPKSLTKSLQPVHVDSAFGAATAFGAAACAPAAAGASRHSPLFRLGWLPAATAVVGATIAAMPAAAPAVASRVSARRFLVIVDIGQLHSGK